MRKKTSEPCDSSFISPSTNWNSFAELAREPDSYSCRQRIHSSGSKNNLTTSSVTTVHKRGLKQKHKKQKCGRQVCKFQPTKHVLKCTAVVLSFQGCRFFSFFSKAAAAEKTCRAAEENVRGTVSVWTFGCFSFIL